ncbi:hypothetical protein ACC685_07740, partial [Rhizobium ruizarguesonis]
MTTFNRMTVVAACEVVGDGNSHNEMEVLEAQWGISGRCSASSKSGRVAALARIAIDEDRGGSVCLNSFGRFAKWISASIMLPPS